MGNFNPSLNFLWSILLPARGVINHCVGQHDESGKDYTSFPLSADLAPRVFRKATLVVKRKYSFCSNFQFKKFKCTGGFWSLGGEVEASICSDKFMLPKQNSVTDVCVGFQLPYWIGPHWWPWEGQQNGNSIQNSINLGKTFLQLICI